MSSIIKMRIIGIRSFDPDTKQMIQFSHPLTLILGPNGTGKTTIIECLKYATTGDMPPNSKRDGGFVHDPKVIHAPEVKAQVQLQFQDTHGKLCIASRSLQATQKTKKVECKTLDSTIRRRSNDGEMVTISSKCAEMDSEMIALLGVSKPILENVIFVHQEEANWPLMEAKTLKEKFDAIFASTRYVKALEQIKKCYQKKGQVIIQFKTEIRFLEHNKNKSEEVKTNLKQVEGKYIASREKVEEIEQKLTPIEKQLDQLNSESGKINKIHTDIEKMKSSKEADEETCSQIRGQLKEEFDGSNEELKIALREFNEKENEARESLMRMERKLEKSDNKQDQLNEHRSSLLLTQGKLEQEAQKHESDISRRGDKIKEYASDYDLTGYRGSISDSDAASFMKDMDTIARDKGKQAGEKKKMYEIKEDELQKKAAEHQAEKTTLETELRMKEEEMQKKQVELRNTKRDLSRIEASSERLRDVERNLRSKNEELDEVQKTVDVDAVKRDIEKLKHERTKIESKLKQLDTELDRIGSESQVRTQLEMLRKDKLAKEDTIKRLINKNEDTLSCCLGEVPTQGFKRAIDDFIKSKQRKMRELKDDLDKSKGQKTKLDTEKQMHLQLFQKMENEVREKKKNLSDVYDGENFEEELESLQRKMKSNEVNIGYLKSVDRVFSKYVTDLKKKPACPLCHRHFGEDGESEKDDLISELEGKIQLVPDKLNKAETDQKKHTFKYETMLQLKPTREVIDELEKTDLPSLKEKIKTCNGKLETVNSVIEERSEDLETFESDLSMASVLPGDMTTIDRTQTEVRELDRKIANHTAKLKPGDNTRTMNEVQTDRAEVNLEKDSIYRKLEHFSDKVSKYTEQVQDLRSEAQELKSEQLKIEKDLQEKIRLETFKDELESIMDILEVEIEETKQQLRPIKRQIEDLNREKDKITRDKERENERARDEFNTIKEHVNEIKRFQMDIEKYAKLKKPEQLQQSKEKMSKLDDEIKRICEDKDVICKEMQELRDFISSQKVQKRELDDNVALRRKREDITKKQRDISRWEEEIKAYDVSNLNKKYRELQREQEDLTSRRGVAKGRMGGYEEDIVRCKKELTDDMYVDADKKYKNKFYELKTTEMAKEDLQKYYRALDQTIMTFHKQKMDELNKIISELWRTTYKGHDIETIEIRTEGEDGNAAVDLDKRRVIQYRVVMMKGDVPLDMRGRCSAGQKVLASLIIRLALAEVFCLHCGILALDEPTTNLDRENIESLARGLIEIIKSRHRQKNFQLIIITHDEDFIELLGRANYVSNYYKVSKDSNGFSKLAEAPVSELHRS